MYPLTHILLKVSLSCTFFEDNKAVIKMLITGRSPTMRHVSRTYRVALHWLFDRINLESKIHIKNVDTKNQLADMLTRGSFTPSSFLFNIMSFSMFPCRHFSDFLSDHQVRKQSAMSKRCQKTTSNEGSPMAKQKPTIPAKARPINLVMRSPRREKRLFTKFGGIRSVRGVPTNEK